MAKHSRTKERRATKKAKRNGEMIPSFAHGGVIQNLEHGFGGVGESFTSGIQDLFSGVNTAISAAKQGALPAGLIPTGQPNVFWDEVSRKLVDFNGQPVGGGPSGFAPLPPSFKPGELEHMQQQLALEKQLGEASLELQQGQLELNKLTEQHAHAIAKGDLQLRREIEARIAAMEKRQFELQSFIQQQQLQLDSQLGSAQGLAGIGRDVGNQSVQRQQFLSDLAANPRDFNQMSIALGGGTSFIDQLRQGQRPEGQGINRAGTTPVLGDAFLKLVEAVTARPEDAFFQQAAEGFQNIQPPPTQQFAHGGKLVTDEPIVGMGVNSGQARFTLGEPNAQFPQGAPEELNITPLTGSAKSASGGAQFPPMTLPFAVQNFGPGGTSTSDILKASQQPTPPQTPFVQNPADPDKNLQKSIDAFGPGGTSISDILRASQQPGVTPPPAPLSPTQEVARLMAPLQPIDFFSMLPSARALLASEISQFGLDPDTIFAEFLRALPTGPNPNAVSFGSFRHGGRVATRVV